MLISKTPVRSMFDFEVEVTRRRFGFQFFPVGFILSAVDSRTEEPRKANEVTEGWWRISVFLCGFGFLSRLSEKLRRVKKRFSRKVAETIERHKGQTNTD